MLNSLQIRNFRNLESLTLPQLGRVNLFVGRNNCGKTSLLEAISIWSTRGRIDRLWQILHERKEIIKIITEERIIYGNDEGLLNEYKNLFYGRQINLNRPVEIAIGENARNQILMSVVKYDVGPTGVKQIVVNENHDYNVGLKLRQLNSRTGAKHVIFSEDVIRRQRNPSYPTWLNSEEFQFVNVQYIEKDYGKEFDSILMTDSYDTLLECLRMIEPDIDRVLPSATPNDNRIMVKLRHQSVAVPLSSMGYGMTRIFAVVMALVSAQGGYLLIDELENGLHWSVQQRILETVFRLSQPNHLNVQVFATTHSTDTIRAFGRASSNEEFAGQGLLIRLSRRNGPLEPVYYTSEEIETALDSNIETR